MARVQKVVLGFREKIYVVELLKGLLVTAGHFFRNLRDIRRVPTIQYPEVKRDLSPRARARHRLTVRKDGSPRCTACMMCATACPAHCIYIVAGEKEPPIEKYPVVFEIDELRCVFCGLCVEACPCDAIRMDSGIIALAENSREEFIYTRDILLRTRASKPWPWPQEGPWFEDV